MIRVSDLMNNVSKENIRAGMNLIYSMMRFIAMTLDMAQDNFTARETITCIAEGVLDQAAELYRDVGEYVAALPNTEGRNNTLEQRNSKEGEENEKDIQC